MMHFSCDLCGKEMTPDGDERYVVKIETFPSHDPAELTEADLDDDQLQALSEMLLDMEEGDDDELELATSSRQLRYDLCPDCHQRFLRDPLGKEHRKKLHFSKN